VEGAPQAAKSIVKTSTDIISVGNLRSVVEKALMTLTNKATTLKGGDASSGKRVPMHVCGKSIWAREALLRSNGSGFDYNIRRAIERSRYLKLCLHHLSLKTKYKTVYKRRGEGSEYGRVIRMTTIGGEKGRRMEGF